MRENRSRPPAQRRRLSAQTIAAGVAGTAMIAASIAIAPHLIGSTQVHPTADTDPNASPPPGVPGFDIDYYHPVTDWNAIHQGGYQFAFAEAADGDVRNTNFDAEYSGIANNGLLRGAYFFARPAEDPTGVRHADAFLSEINYQADGKTLPPVLDATVNGVTPAAPMDADVFNGSLTDLQALASNGKSEAAYELCLQNAGPAECASLQP